MNIIAFIPSRYESKRFPGKPLAPIAGKPMIQHVYQNALSCSEISEVYVATDDERIFKCVHDFGGKAIMTDKTHHSGTDRIAEATRKMKIERDCLIVNIQGDQPIFQTSSITRLITPMIDDQHIPMGTLKYRITNEKDVHNPNYVKVVTDREGFALYFSRSPLPFFRDDASEKVYYKHLGFYIYRNDFLQRFASLPVGRLESAEKLEQLRALENGFRIKVMETSFDSIEVDTPDDIKKVEEMM
jgi:3-deoxy-manno-octulosonate cytidylyltransferase (CMP-KDO synthetase)